jgi:hypothetical protein
MTCHLRSLSVFWNILGASFGNYLDKCNVEHFFSSKQFCFVDSNGTHRVLVIFWMQSTVIRTCSISLVALQYLYLVMLGEEKNAAQSNVLRDHGTSSFYLGGPCCIERNQVKYAT